MYIYDIIYIYNHVPIPQAGLFRKSKYTERDVQSQYLTSVFSFTTLQ